MFELNDTGAEEALKRKHKRAVVLNGRALMCWGCECELQVARKCSGGDYCRPRLMLCLVLSQLLLIVDVDADAVDMMI